MAEDRSVIPTANTKDKVAEFGASIFGMPKLRQTCITLEKSRISKEQ